LSLLLCMLDVTKYTIVLLEIEAVRLLYGGSNWTKKRAFCVRLDRFRTLVRAQPVDTCLAANHGIVFPLTTWTGRRGSMDRIQLGSSGFISAGSVEGKY